MTDLMHPWQRFLIDAALTGRTIIMEATRKGPRWAVIEKENAVSTDYQQYGHELPEPQDLTDEQKASDADLKEALETINAPVTGDLQPLDVETEPDEFVPDDSRVNDL